MKAKLLALMLCLSLLFAAVPMTLAQEATDTPPVVEVGGDVPVVVEGNNTTIEEAGDVVITEEDTIEPLQLIIGMATAVFGIMELLKNTFISRIADANKWTEETIAAVNWLVASLLAFLLMAGAPEGVNIFTITGYPNPLGDIFARVVTAAVIGGGNGIIHVVYDFLRTARLRPSAG